MKNKFENEKWEMLEHSWSDTSIYNQDNKIICTLSIDDEDTTEENQEEREQLVSENFKLISKAPELFSLVNKLITSEETPLIYRKQAKELISLITE